MFVLIAQSFFKIYLKLIHVNFKIYVDVSWRILAHKKKEMVKILLIIRFTIDKMNDGATMKEEGKLEEWKEIAKYLHIGVRTAQRKEKKFGLPIHRDDDEYELKPRVYAYKAELDKWKNRGREGKLDEKQISEQMESKEQASLSVPQKNHLNKYFRTGLYSLILIIVGVSMGAVFVSFGRQEIDNPVDFNIVGSQLIILGENGRELWRYDTGIRELWQENKYRKYFQFKRHEMGAVLLPRLIIQDINADGANEVLFSTRTLSEYGAGTFHFFSSKGEEKWSFSGARELKFGKTTYSNDTRIFGIEVCNLDDQGTPEIVVIGGHIPYFPSYLVVLDINGNIQGEFWNSGYMIDIVFNDFNGDGRNEIVVSGVNNEYKQGFLAVFDSNDIRGASPQQNDEYICRDFEPSSAKYYIRLPRTDVDLLEEELEFCSNLFLLKNGNISTITRSSNLIYEFNSNFEIVNVGTSNRFQFKHRKAVREGKISSELNDQYLKNLAAGIRYHNGREWVAKHSLANEWNIRKYN